jgi:hypothetical protein
LRHDFISLQCGINTEQVCFILDDNAYVIANSRFEHEGKFFGAVDPKLMRMLYDDDIYIVLTIYDYQGVCYQDRMVVYEAVMEVLSNAGWSIGQWNIMKAAWTFVMTVLASIGGIFSAAPEKPYVPNCEYDVKG